VRKISILNFITFLAAFLLFQIELIVSKIFLPNFGGSYLVWGSCVVFFQAVLFCGYFYSYAILKKVGMKRYAPFYIVLFLLPLLCFPGRSFPELTSVDLKFPLVLNVFWHLIWTVGPVFFVLSTVSVMLQSWLSDSDLEERKNPYMLYALSNLGSFGALITYPFLFESFFDLDQQIFFWRVMYFLLLGLVILAVFSVKVKRESKIAKIWNIGEISGLDCQRWFFFSAAGVIMFLSVTNIATYEVAPIPLLWIVPLSIYLLSFVLSFKNKPWEPAWITEKFYLTFAWSLLMFFMVSKRIFPFILELGATYFFLFHACMFCQYNLNKTKPLNTDNLPLFYLIIAFGGFVGGIFTTWLMPLISVSISEYLLGLAFIAIALVTGIKRQAIGWRSTLLIAYVSLSLILWPMIYKNYNIFGLIAIFLIFKICHFYLIKKPNAFFLNILMVLLITPFIDSIWTENYIYRHRNYYGLYKVSYDGSKYILTHGTTIHGAQFKDKERESEPLTYYHKFTPIGELMSSQGEYFRNIGLIGLGSGALAAYMQQGQEGDFFEIDPDVYSIAKNLFTYVKNSKGKLNFIFGDARLKIKEITAKRYDLLAVDAFSGDAIPVHLLTTDAIEEYKKHLKNAGLILFHISNRYLDFIPVLFSNANYLGAYSCYKNNKAGENDLYASSWFALTWDLKAYSKLVGEFEWIKYDPCPCKKWLIRPWTDKYSNMLLIMRLDDSLDSIRYFQPFYW